MKRSAILFSSIAISISLILSVLPSKLDSNFLKLRCINLQAIAEGESGKLEWSDDIDCPVPYPGDFNVCLDNGGGNTCSTFGEKTCDCEEFKCN